MMALMRIGTKNCTGISFLNIPVHNYAHYFMLKAVSKLIWLLQPAFPLLLLLRAKH